MKNTKIHSLITSGSLLFSFFIAIFLSAACLAKASEDAAPNQIPVLELGSPQVYLPVVMKLELPLMAGIYPSGWINQKIIDDELKPLDAWVSGISGGLSTAIIGTFMDMTVDDQNAYVNVEQPLTTAWTNGYTPFVNLAPPSGKTSLDIAAGNYDSHLRSWAKSFRNFSDGGKRFAYIAPMQEMNGYWVDYSNDPTNYIIAFKHIRDIFAQEGVPARSVKWVFAPNGWGRQDMPRFEAYYPGDAFVDIVAISAYNWGYCQGAVWEEPETVFNNPALGTTHGHYLDRLRAMAPSKPIFIAETGSSSFINIGTNNYDEKDRWLRDAYQYLSAQPNVKAVLYFNTDKECDWTIFRKDGDQFDGYREGVNDNGYTYIAPEHLWLIP